MHLITDAQLIIGLAIAGVHLIGSGVIVWKSFANGRGIDANGRRIDRNHHDIVNLDASNAAISREMTIVRNSLTRIQGHLDGRPTTGTRATDTPGPPPPMRAPTPKVAGVTPRQIWPLGGIDSPP